MFVNTHFICRFSCGLLFLMFVVMMPTCSFAEPDVQLDDMTLDLHESVTPISTDRPNFTASPDVIEKGAFQLESGLLFENQREGAAEAILPELALRYGLGNEMELQVFPPVLALRTQGVSSPEQAEPIYWSDLKLGFKRRLIGSQSSRFKWTLYPVATLPTGTSALSLNHNEIAINNVFGYQINAKTQLASQITTALATEGPVVSTAGTLVLYRQLTKKWSVFAEVAAFRPFQANLSTAADVGVQYLLTPLQQLDARVGVRQDNAGFTHAFAALGYSFRTF